MAGPSAEWLRLNGQLVAVPSVVCERRPAFDAALSQAAWDALSEEHRKHLRVRRPSAQVTARGRGQAMVGVSGHGGVSLAGAPHCRHVSHMSGLCLTLLPVTIVS